MNSKITKTNSDNVRKNIIINLILFISITCLQCFDTVGWAAGSSDILVLKIFLVLVLV